MTEDTESPDEFLDRITDDASDHEKAMEHLRLAKEALDQTPMPVSAYKHIDRAEQLLDNDDA